MVQIIIENSFKLVEGMNIMSRMLGSGIKKYMIVKLPIKNLGKYEKDLCFDIDGTIHQYLGFLKMPNHFLIGYKCQ